MSDCKTTYRKVKEFVKCLYPDQLNGNLARNMNTLTAMIYRYHYWQRDPASSDRSQRA